MAFDLTNYLTRLQHRTANREKSGEVVKQRNAVLSVRTQMIHKLNKTY